MTIQEANQKVQKWIDAGNKNANLILDGLTSAEGLTLPTDVGLLYLNGLTSAEGLTLPESVEGGIYLSSLPESEKEILRQGHPNLADKIN